MMMNVEGDDDGRMDRWGNVHGYREATKKKRKIKKEERKRKKDVLNNLTHAR